MQPVTIPEGLIKSLLSLDINNPDYFTNVSKILSDAGFKQEYTFEKGDQLASLLISVINDPNPECPKLKLIDSVIAFDDQNEKMINYNYKEKEYGNNPLMAAIKSEQKEIACLLARHEKVRFYAINHEGQSLLKLAINMPVTKVFAAMLAVRNPDAHKPKYFSYKEAIQLAVDAEKSEVIDLIKGKAKSNTLQDADYHDLEIEAIKSGNPQLVRSLIDSQSFLSKKPENEQGFTDKYSFRTKEGTLLFAIRNENYNAEIVKALLENMTPDSQLDLLKTLTRSSERYQKEAHPEALQQIYKYLNENQTNLSNGLKKVIPWLIIFFLVCSFWLFIPPLIALGRIIYRYYNPIKDEVDGVLKTFKIQNKLPQETERSVFDKQIEKTKQQLDEKTPSTSSPASKPSIQATKSESPTSNHTIIIDIKK